jgi:hypothetical protein
MPRIIRWLMFLAAACATGCSGEPDDVVDPSIPRSGAHSAAKYAGHLQAVNNAKIVGWVWDPSRPDEPIEVTILDGSTVLMSLKADRFRQGLQDKKKGNGKHAFEVPMPQSLKDGQPHEIHAVVSGTDFELTESPRTYQFQQATQ